MFSTEERPFGRTEMISHNIDTGDHPPIHSGIRPSSLADRATIREEVDKMLKTGTIQPSKSPWASAVVLVRKKDSKPSFCVDYRRLNNITKKDVHPIPRQTDFLETLAKASLFSTFDCASGYWAVRLTARKRLSFAQRDSTSFWSCHSDYVMRQQRFNGLNIFL